MIRMGAIVRFIHTHPDESPPMTDPSLRPWNTTHRHAGARAFLLAVLVAAAEAAEAAPAADRVVEDAARELLARSDALRPLLIGEIHGTRETPALLASMLRQGSGRPWLLGLEIPRQEQERIDAFLRSDGGARARATLTGGAFWVREQQDGRSSEAMLQLIDAVRALRHSGRDIHVVCFDDVAEDGDARDRDARMAQALRTALATERHRRAVALMGNYHARIGRGAPWNAQQEFLGWHLRDLSPQSVDVGAPTGSSWVCNPDCGVYRFGADRAPGDGALRMAAQADEKGYVGTLTLPHFTASPPAIEPPAATKKPDPLP
jgi:hypothetical protein